MAEHANVMSFQAGDRFLRRVRFADHLRRGVVHWRAFKDDDETLSLTFQDDSLKGNAAILDYQEHFSAAIGGDLPGLLWFSFDGLTSRLDPPLPPRHDPDSSDSRYGHLHCSTDKPRDRAHMQLLQKLVNDGEFAGVLFRFVKRSAA